MFSVIIISIITINIIIDFNIICEFLLEAIVILHNSKSGISSNIKQLRYCIFLSIGPNLL